MERQKIKDYLQAKKIRQRQLAIMCGLDPSTVSKHVTGSRKVDLESCRRYFNGTRGELNLFGVDLRLTHIYRKADNPQPLGSS